MCRHGEYGGARTSNAAGKAKSGVFSARSELRKVLFLAPSVCCFLFVYEISPEPLNGFTPNSHGRRVLSLSQTSLKVKVKCHRSRSPLTEDKNVIFSPFISAACVRFMFGKTSLASSLPCRLSVTLLNGKDC